MKALLQFMLLLQWDIILIDEIIKAPLFEFCNLETHIVGFATRN